MQTYGLKNPDGTINVSRKDHISAVIVSVLQAGAFFGALTSAPISGMQNQSKTLVRAFESHSYYRCKNSLFWEEENPSHVLPYLLSRRREYFIIVSF